MSWHYFPNLPLGLYWKKMDLRDIYASLGKWELFIKTLIRNIGQTKLRDITPCDIIPKWTLHFVTEPFVSPHNIPSWTLLPCFHYKWSIVASYTCTIRRNAIPSITTNRCPNLSQFAHPNTCALPSNHCHRVDLASLLRNKECFVDNNQWRPFYPPNYVNIICNSRDWSTFALSLSLMKWSSGHIEKIHITLLLYIWKHRRGRWIF